MCFSHLLVIGYLAHTVTNCTQFLIPFDSTWRCQTRLSLEILMFLLLFMCTFPAVCLELHTIKARHYCWCLGVGVC